MVYRVYVEKKPELANEAAALKADAKSLLGISSLEDVRVINRYDAENIDPELFDALKKIVARGRDKSVKMVQDAGLIPGAEYFGEKLKSSKLEVSAREWDRRLWFNNAALLLGDSELVFADPDNETRVQQAIP